MTLPHLAALEQVPDLTAISAAWPNRYPFLLDSAAEGPLSQYSLLLRASDEALVLDTDGRLQGPGQGHGFLERLDDWFRTSASGQDAGTGWPFGGGWFVFLGYELAREIEPVLELPAAGDDFPVALAVRCKGAVMIRHAEPHKAVLVAEDPAELELMRQEVADAQTPAAAVRTRATRLDADPAAAFEAQVGAIHEYLLDGDVFQVNLSRAWRGQFQEPADTGALYRQLRRANPAPFAGCMRWGGQVLMSSSPERLVEVRGHQVQARPIAGTHPRGHDAASDRELSEQMLAHPKERAEHIMLIDLERNDLGRVCESGSVEVSELMVVETYAHVHHIVSNVRGWLKHGTTPVDVIRAVFPGGTITGCPKVRCMQIIAELERRGRGFYTGSMGYIDRNGNMDLNILIRSMLVSGRDFGFRTGAGIVADSEPRREVAETEAKAQGLLAALSGEAAGTVLQT